MKPSENLFRHQHVGELMELLKRIAGAKSVLEIGSAEGHTLAAFAMESAPGARICSIDAGLAPKALAESMERIKAAGYDAHLYQGDSKSEEALEFAKSMGPFDFIFIDGDHSYEGVKLDWESYGHLGKVVGFHDVAHPHHEVSRFWAEMKAVHKTEEIVMSMMGIGLVYQERT